MLKEIDKIFDDLEHRIFSQIEQERQNHKQNSHLNSIIRSLEEEIKKKEDECIEAKQTCIEIAKQLHKTITKIKSILKCDANKRDIR